jgi:ankyrin repeat protein
LKNNSETTILRLLLEGGAAKFIDNAFKGETARLACQMGNADVLALLIRYGADITTHYNGQTCMTIAASGNRIDCLQILIDAQDPPEAKGHERKRKKTDLTPVVPAAFKDSGSCSICLDKKSIAVFMDCGHCCTCKTCSVPLQVCPICRMRISKCIHLIFS